MNKPLEAALAVAALLALACGGWWLMDGWIAYQGWAVWNGQKWAVVAVGWPMAVQTWPVALMAATALLGAFWPILAWAARRQAETALAGRRADLERQRQALEQKRQALDRDKRESLDCLDTQRQALNDIHAQRLAEIEGRIERIEIPLENALAEAREKTRQAEARADMAEKQLERTDKGRKNATWAAARMKKKFDQNASKAPVHGGD